MDIIEKLTEIFKEFPGIGERQADVLFIFLCPEQELIIKICPA